MTDVGEAAALGFDTSARAWREKPSGTAFERLPTLDGVLLITPAALAPYATDAGNMVSHHPSAVLFPGSVGDVQEMIRFCGRHGVHVAARGQGHSTFGQSQTRGGLAIDMSTLNQVHEISPRGASVGAGLKWSELVAQTIPQGLRPPVLTGFIGLSIGGTLSVGGVSPFNNGGAQVDHVREIDVVTGTGELLTCSQSQNVDLFEMALAGLGQCGIITRAEIELVPAPPMVRTYTLNYTDVGTFFADLRKLLGRGELHEIYALGVPDNAGGWIYQLTVAQPFEPGLEPDRAGLLRDLCLPSAAAQITDLPALDYALRVDVQIDSLRRIGLWEGVLHPWFDVFLPERAVEHYVTGVMSSLTPEDVGPTGYLLLFPLRRSKITRPLLRVPEGDDWIYLFDILTSASAPGPNPEFEQRMLVRNRRLFEQARRVGGTRYPIGALEFSQADWVTQYGEQWQRLVRLKARFDPAHILTPGLEIFE